MSVVETLIARVQSREPNRKAYERLGSRPGAIRLAYQHGHPGIWEPGAYWMARIGAALRLVDSEGDRMYELPLSRVGYACTGPGNEVHLCFEPTPGLRVTVVFTADEPLEALDRLDEFLR
jgi:hypothetical protein